MSVPDGLLVLLRGGPRHGYQLAAKFAERTAGRWSLNTGQVYTTLERLVRDDLVEPDGARQADSRRRSYRLTDAGAARAERWLATPPAPGEPRDELVLRVLLAVAADPARGLEVIDLQRAQLLDDLRAVRQRQRDAGDGLLERLAADAEACRLEASARWLDLAEARLRSTLRRPEPGAPR